MARHDATTPIPRRVRLATAALLAAVAVLTAALVLPASSPAGSPAAHAAAAKKKPKRLSKRARCLRWARKGKTKRKRAARRRACLRPTRKPSPPSARQSFGIAVGGDLQNEDPATLARDLDAIRNLHVGWIRADINRASIEYAGPLQYNWAATDRMIQGARARNLNVVGVIGYTPNWARPPGTRANLAPDPGQYAVFAATAARRYAALGVHVYELWNEPNSGDAWTPRVDPAAYAQLLRAAYPAIKAADPQATVLLGGLGPAANDGYKVAPVSFLQAVYAAGGGGFFDGVAHHPYTFPAGHPGEAQSWSPWYQMYGTTPSLRSVMIAHGDGAKKIWGTEYGASTGGPDSVSEPAQAGFVSQAVATWQRYPWAGPLFFYETRDMATSGSNRDDFFGLLRHDFSPKPAYGALQSSLSSG